MASDSSGYWYAPDDWQSSSAAVDAGKNASTDWWSNFNGTLRTVIGGAIAYKQASTAPAVAPAAARDQTPVPNNSVNSLEQVSPLGKQLLMIAVIGAVVFFATRGAK